MQSNSNSKRGPIDSLGLDSVRRNALEDLVGTLYELTDDEPDFDIAVSALATVLVNTIVERASTDDAACRIAGATALSVRAGVLDALLAARGGAAA